VLRIQRCNSHWQSFFVANRSAKLPRQIYDKSNQEQRATVAFQVSSKVISNLITYDFMNVVGLQSRFQISPLLGHLVCQFLPIQVRGIKSIRHDFRDEGADCVHLVLFHPFTRDAATLIFLYPSFFVSNDLRYLLLSLLLPFFDEIPIWFEMTISLKNTNVKNVNGQSPRQ
jgi:hypothetical protein